MLHRVPLGYIQFHKDNEMYEVLSFCDTKLMDFWHMHCILYFFDKDEFTVCKDHCVEHHYVWQRASSVRRFVLQYLEQGQTFKGNSVWTVKQILTWCRLHAYSPHYLERPLHPTAIDLQAETSLPSDQQHRKFTSLTDSNEILQEVTSLQDLGAVVEYHSDEEIDIISAGTEKPRVKQKVDVPIPYSSIEMLPLTEGATFVENVVQEIGVKLVQTEVEPGYLGTVSHGILYRAMELFMGDILRETFALKVNMGRYPDALGVADVYSALNSQPITDFLTNKFLGVEENHGLPKVDR